ncbi:MAG: prepilin peptidase [Chlorogloeopsis fritschii C42_A2020_084]|uniref:prepilin peptidase n=1 Tax=Chlorogloeopsis fritschii TaxID=1124 RepID=UPI0019F76002|nr:A24 family peptidase [Chlorogloeopsis fritschii]MBF2007563.1 prepilin peptidase [Chlorogloeopsis fritschii C42_A2020_084]
MDLLIVTLANVIVFALGASIGSFINVVVYRLPAGLSILFPPSRCPHCLNQLQAYDNVPVLGWLWLKGRCRYCQSKISLRYPVVEAVTGFLFLLIFWNFHVSPLTLGYWVFCSWLLTLSLIDLDTMTLPNPLTQSGLVLGIVFQMMVGFLSEKGWVGWANHSMTAISGAVLGLWLFNAIATVGSVVFGKTAMGGGDAKLAAMMGAWLGWKHLLLAAFVACFLGALVGGGAILLSRYGAHASFSGQSSHITKQKTRPTLPQKWGQKMPFGPFLALGALIIVFSGEAILSTYLQLFFHGI